MPKFVTIGYGDLAGYERTPQRFAMPLMHTTKSCGSAGF